ncbi:MAG: hypothetical protein Q9184_004988 [Pyrenodesmia sp. 2 TL-2023]
MPPSPSPSTSTYTSHLSLPYTTPSLSLRTLDLHIPTTTPPLPHLPSYTLIYIHGGAFRDPLITSQSLLPALPHLFPSTTKKQTHVAAIASVNYRLSPYPTHATQPSDPEDGSRNAKWPDHVRDVRAAIEWLSSSNATTFSDNDGDDGGERSKVPKLPREYILIGHSVGATIAFALALGLDHKEAGAEVPKSMKIKAVVGVEGVYDFTALRDAHVDYRGIYEEFTTAAFGGEEEEDEAWERGNMVRAVRDGRGREERTEVVVLGQSRGDELVEWGQVEVMGEALRGTGWRRVEDGGEGKGKEVMVVELKGGHDEIWEQGRELAKCIALAVEKCVQRDSACGS